jgi:hypothetical protein
MRAITVSSAIALALIMGTAHADTSLAQLSVNGGSLRFDGAMQYEREVRIRGPQGEHFELKARAGEAAQLSAALSDGIWVYEVMRMPSLEQVDRERLVRARETGTEASVIRALIAEGKLQAQPDVEVASFVVSGGRVLAASMDGETEAQGKVEGNREAAKAVVLTDVDGVIRQSLCVGTDCATTESFGFDTLRLKENNTRIAFADTSTGTFPAVNWQLVANDSASGGRNMFSFLDVTNSREIFTVEAAAPATSLYVDDSGRIGLRTSTPVLELHVSDGDTPGLRLEQNGSTGFTPQTWDVAGNEANFFVRDVTGGSRLSFRIRPGAPTSSIDIASSGNVGIGSGSPDGALHVARTSPGAGDSLLLVSDETNNVEYLRLSGEGNLRVRGTVSQLSSAAAKHAFESLDVSSLLARVRELALSEWSYRHQPGGARHYGPTAEDFHRVFGLGEDAKSISPGDMAGIALASIQALDAQLQQKDQRIAELEARLARIEAMLGGTVANAQ